MREHHSVKNFTDHKWVHIIVWEIYATSLDTNQ